MFFSFFLIPFSKLNVCTINSFCWKQAANYWYLTIRFTSIVDANEWMGRMKNTIAWSQVVRVWEIIVDYKLVINFIIIVKVNCNYSVFDYIYLADSITYCLMMLLTTRNTNLINILWDYFNFFLFNLIRIVFALDNFDLWCFFSLLFLFFSWRISIFLTNYKPLYSIGYIYCLLNKSGLNF